MSLIRSNKFRLWTRALILAALLVLAFGGRHTASGGPYGSRYFPNVPLTTHDGEQVYFYEDLIKDKVVAINFIYTSCPDSCPAETAKLRQVYQILGDRVGRDVFMYSISIDPEHDTPAVLKKFATKFRIGPGWVFLTGKEEDITLLRRKLGLYMEEIQDGSGDHNLSLIVGNERTGKWITRSPFDDPTSLATLIGHDLFGGITPRENVRSYSEVPDVPKFSRGEYLYRSRCTSCHTIGAGDSLGPDLLGVTEQREHAWLMRWLKEPDKMLAEGDPIARDQFARYNELAMPNLRLDDADAAALIAYMAAQSRGVRQAD
ncbi:MAG: SCO family protein [Myxococcales bacterium]|nr:SCO family protein [Myxococcales bacterium]